MLLRLILLLGMIQTACATPLAPQGSTDSIQAAENRLNLAIQNPEFMLTHWIELPTSPIASHKKAHYLTLREAILLALRYNPNIRNAELDRIVQRYQLRIAHNAFELQYALAGTAYVEKSKYSGIGSTTTKTFLASPELDLKTKLGSQLSLNMDNNVAADGNYNPLLNFNFTQPLLRGFGKDANEAPLLNAIDQEVMNKLNLQQSVMDQITEVIVAYRSLILSGNNLQSQRRQLQEAKETYDINEKKIKAGQLEPTGNIQQSYQIESLNLMQEQADNDFLTAAQNLLQTIGLDPNTKLAVPDNVRLDKIKIPSFQEAIEQALTHNTQYTALKMALRADERAYKAAQNQQLWQLDATANVQAGMINNVDNRTPNTTGIYNGRNITETAGLTLTIPIHDLSRRSELINTKVRLEKDRLNLLAAKRALMTNIKNIMSSIESLAKRYELAQRQVMLAEKSYTIEKKKRLAGIATALDVNNTQNQLLQAQMGLINAKIAYLNQVSALQRLLGTTLKAWNIQLRYAG